MMLSIVAVAWATLIANGCPAQGQPVGSNGNAAAAQTMPPIADMAEPPSPAATPPAKCPIGQQLDPAMAMCMTTPAKPKPAATIRINQFLAHSATSGPRGHERVTGPGAWMLAVEKDLSPRNTLHVSVMGSLEQLTVGSIGTPQLLQTENLDAMHSHDTLMAVEFRDTIKLGTSNSQDLTILFAPRGGAAFGPVPYMHRDSAEGNPDAPLGHNMQDGFHDVSTVFGLAYRVRRTTIEATAFSGHDLSWPLPLHRPDSFAFRLSHRIDDHVTLGGSYADVLTPDDAGGAEHEKFIAAWLATNHQIQDLRLRTSIVWGRARAAASGLQNSFLAEAALQRDANNLFARAELLEVTPEQLSLVQAGDSGNPRWVGAITLGYERAVLNQGPFSLFAGNSITKDFVPSAFDAEYGRRRGGVKVFLRMKIGGFTGMSAM
ncbi:MAG: hypothetical protein ABIT68_06620 [Sphingomicrobium sp.]